MTRAMLDRRRLLGATLGAFGVASAGGMSAEIVGAEPQKSGGIRRPGRYADSLIFERTPSAWPGGKTLAVWVIPNVEVWAYDSVAGVAISPSTVAQAPDVINYARREYGMRVGLWRIADVLDSAGIVATVALNSAVCELFPQAIEQMKNRGWEFMGHGTTNSESLRGLSRQEEQQLIRTSLETIQNATGERPRGWLSPGLGQTFATLDILAEAGVIYNADWNNDDQPYPMEVASGKMFALPYCMMINDIGFYLRSGHSGEEYYRAVTDQFDTLYADSSEAASCAGDTAPPISHRTAALYHVLSAGDSIYQATRGCVVRYWKRNCGRLSEGLTLLRDAKIAVFQ